jgi:hypothetical protein
MRVVTSWYAGCGSVDRSSEIPRYVDTLLDGADYAKGSRFAAGGTSHDITPVRKLGNVFLNTTVNVLYRTRYTDLCYGYNAFWRDVPAGARHGLR